MIDYSLFHRYVIFPLVEKRNGIVTKKHLDFLTKSQCWTHEELDRFKLKRLKIVIQHAYDNTVFYNKKFKEIGFHPNDIKKIEDISILPTVTRGDLIENLDDMIAINIASRDRHVSSTGGSTGLATKFARDNACLSIKKASEYRFNMWAGWLPGKKILAYWPALIDFSGDMSKFDKIKSLLFSRHISLYSGKLNEVVLADHLKEYNKFCPDLIRAFPSALQKFAEYIVDSGKKIYKPKGIVSVGEPLIQSQRELFSKVFECDVFNCYVSRECGNIASECLAHEGLHIAEELIYLEIINQGNNGFGEILLTDLWNMGMPLIRYRIQDAAKFINGTCSCGSNNRRIGVEAARLSEFLVSPVDGSFVSGSTLVHYLLAEGPKVGRVKIIQDAPNHLTVVISGNATDTKESKEHIEKRLHVIFEGSMRVDFRFVDSIPLLKSGKYSFVERRF